MEAEILIRLCVRTSDGSWNVRDGWVTRMDPPFPTSASLLRPVPLCAPGGVFLPLVSAPWGAAEGPSGCQNLPEPPRTAPVSPRRDPSPGTLCVWKKSQIFFYAVPRNSYLSRSLLNFGFWRCEGGSWRGAPCGERVHFAVASCRIRASGG